MQASEARVIANRKNALQSTGPKTEEGKARSRRNSLKHGLTGAGIVVAEVDAVEVARRNEALQSELAPESTLGQILVRKMALLSVRMERSGRQEIAAIAERVRHAEDDFEQDQLDDAERLFESLKEAPKTSLRRLKNTPAGVDRLILGWRELRADLSSEALPIWTPWHRERADNLTGFRLEEASGSRIGALSKALWGDYSGLEDGRHLDDATKTRFARLLLLERIDEEIASLEAHYETLDFDTLAIDRAEAPERALFDPSRVACLARRYEAEASRGFYKAFHLLLEVEAAPAEPIGSDVTSAPVETCNPLASSRETPVAVVREPRPRAGFCRPNDVIEVSRAVERVDHAAFTTNSRT